jgi:hypothetical protein
VTVEVFDINKEQGGLKPLKQGGSRQTTNLRLEDSLGREYVLRSVDKTPSRALPKELQKTIAGDIMQDQISAANPFGAMTIPHMAKAAGVYYTNPKLVFIPHDTSFGEFSPVFSNMLAYIEDRPNNDMSHQASSGYSKKVIGSEKLFESLYADKDNAIDQPFFLRTRLFDMLIGDWGRHEDQWRWATFENGKGKLYRPIPRDRDHVFFKFDGVLPYLASRKWSIRNFRNFDYNYKDVVGLNLSATSLDRAVLTSLTLKQWLTIAEELKASLPDSTIENAINMMPKEAFKYHGNEIIKKLKSRRDQLPALAESYYKELSKKVDIVGSEKKERFIVNRLNNAETEVLVLKSKADSDTIYRRIFFTNETKEIRLIGLGGDDAFNIDGKTKKGPLLRIIGGEGMDAVLDSSAVKGCKRRNLVYDTYTGSEISKSHETRDLRSDKVRDSINDYKRAGYLYNFTAPIPSFEFNVDDGLFLGLAMLRKTHGFRKKPYASSQRLGVNYSTNTNAFSVRYRGDFKKIINNWNLTLNGRYSGPKYALNYFGFGNESFRRDTAIVFYRFKASEVYFSPVLYRTVTKHFEIGFGPSYQHIKIARTPGRFVTSSESRIDSSAFDASQYVGLRLYTQLSTLDNNINPLKGIRWFIEGGYYKRLSTSENYQNISSELSAFFTPKLPVQITFASRVGGGTNFGEFQFFQANTLGGTTNLRGFRRTRFYGRTSFFQNTEVRVKLFDLNLYLFPGKIGILGFYDYGRVWADNEKSHLWHTGYGPGLWLQVYKTAVITATYGISEEESLFNLQFSFLF